MTDNPGFELRDVWLKYRVRYHRPRSLRAVVAASSLRAVRTGLQAVVRSMPWQPKDEPFWALRGITLSAGPGEVVGIVGSNGAGKSTLLRVMARILKPDRGVAIVRGTIGTLLTFGAGFNTELTGRENVFLNGSILGLTQNEIKDRLEAIVELAGVGDFFDAPVSSYSSGMRARLGFSVAVHVNPDVLLVDEVVQVGDAFFQRKAGTILDQFRGQRKVIALVTHNPGQVERYCTRAVWMEHGEVRREGAPADVMAEYLAWSESQVQAAKGQRRPAAV